jgi:hypothetical protein
MSAIKPVSTAARLVTLKVVVPPETMYLEKIQLGMVSDLSVQRSEAQVGTRGMSIARAVFARRTTAEISLMIPILKSKTIET